VKAQIIMRSQKSRGSGSNPFGGPDRYVVVLARTDDMEPLPAHTPLQVDRVRALREEEAEIIEALGPDPQENADPGDAGPYGWLK